MQSNVGKRSSASEVRQRGAQEGIEQEPTMMDYILEGGLLSSEEESVESPPWAERKLREFTSHTGLTSKPSTNEGAMALEQM